jgi:hypothetical protein
MKLDPSMHIGLHMILFGNTGVTNTLRAFVKMVEGSEMSKFGIPTLVQFSCKFLRKFSQTELLRNDLDLEHEPCATSRRARPVVLTTIPPGTHARRCTPVTVGLRQGSVGTMCLRGMTRRLAIGRCHAARSHAPVPARRGRHRLATPPQHLHCPSPIPWLL